MTALWVAVWWCLLAPLASRASLVVSSCGSRPLWGLCCSLPAFPYLRVGALLACGVYGASSRSRLPFVVSPPSHVCLSFTCSCGEVVWSQVCGPSCCSCVLGSCGVSVTPFRRLGLLSALPCRVFAGWFLWFSGPCSWSFLGLLLGVFPLASGSSWLLGVVLG